MVTLEQAATNADNAWDNLEKDSRKSSLSRLQQACPYISGSWTFIPELGYLAKWENRFTTPAVDDKNAEDAPRNLNQHTGQKTYEQIVDIYF